jgi:hypothetical protein
MLSINFCYFHICRRVKRRRWQCNRRERGIGEHRHSWRWVIALVFGTDALHTLHFLYESYLTRCSFFISLRGKFGGKSIDSLWGQQHYFKDQWRNANGVLQLPVRPYWCGPWTQNAFPEEVGSHSPCNFVPPLESHCPSSFFRQKVHLISLRFASIGITIKLQHLSGKCLVQFIKTLY